MNKVILIWNITQDLELKQTTNWKSVMNFSIATNKRVKVSEWEYENKWEFHNLVAWNKTAELIEKYQSKWSKIWIVWELQTRNWEAEDWTKRYRTEIIVNEVEFLSSAKNNDEFEDIPDPTPKKRTKKKVEDISVDDIPF